MTKLYAALLIILSILVLGEKAFAQSLQVTNTRIDINNINAIQSNNGFSDYNINSNSSGVEYPKGSGKTAIHISGFLWGGYVRGDSCVRIGGSAYRSGLQPGPIINGVAADPQSPKYSIYRVRQDIYPGGPDLDLSSIAATEGVSQSVLRVKYESDWTNWPAAGTSNDLGAPFQDVNNDGKYEPDIDMPGIPGAVQTVYYVVNDLDTSLTKKLYGTLPVGIELHVACWAYTYSGAMYNTYFKKYTLINKGQNIIDSMYASYWSAVELGYAGDDLAACDTILNLSFAYNANAQDSINSSYYPPAVGFSLFQGPVVKGQPSNTAVINFKEVSGMINLPMTSSYVFTNLNTSNDSLQPIFIYRSFKGEDGLTGELFTDGNGNATRFEFPGDPRTQTGWLDKISQPPGNRVLGFASGHFTFAPGDTQEVVVAEIFGGSTSSNFGNLNAITYMKLNWEEDLKEYRTYFNITSAGREQSNIANDFLLSQNYPNPFNPSTTINYSVPKTSFVTIKVYDVLGKEISTLVNGEKQAGNYRVLFNAGILSSGIYFYKMSADGYSVTKKLILVK